jgi:hypothetical protein
VNKVVRFVENTPIRHMLVGFGTIDPTEAELVASFFVTPSDYAGITGIASAVDRS